MSIMVSHRRRCMSFFSNRQAAAILLEKTFIIILIELKAAGNFSGDKLKQLSETALAQIQDRKYDTDIISKGFKTIFKYGVAFSGKQEEIAVASQ